MVLTPWIESRPGARNAPTWCCAAPSLLAFPVRPRPSLKSCCNGWTRRSWIEWVASNIPPLEGATANALGGHIPADVQEERYGRFMERAAVISAQRLAAKVGRKMRVLVDEVDNDVAIARSEADASRDDGVVRIAKAGKLRAGDWADVEITDADDYDLTARLTKPADERLDLRRLVLRRPSSRGLTLFLIRSWFTKRHSDQIPV